MKIRIRNYHHMFQAETEHPAIGQKLSSHFPSDPNRSEACVDKPPDEPQRWCVMQVHTAEWPNPRAPFRTQY